MVSCISFCRDDKVKIVWLMKAWEVRMAGVRGSRGGKMETTVFEQQYKNKKIKIKTCFYIYNQEQIFYYSG